MKDCFIDTRPTNKKYIYKNKYSMDYKNTIKSIETMDLKMMLFNPVS